MKISDEDVGVYNEGVTSSYEKIVRWEVKSQTTPGVVHTVNLLVWDCSVDLCMESCLELSCAGLCAHMFSCSCSDKFGICKHILCIWLVLRAW